MFIMYCISILLEDLDDFLFYWDKVVDIDVNDY